MEIYRKYPLKRLIVTPERAQACTKVRSIFLDFSLALRDCPWPVWYNGDIFSPDSLNPLENGTQSIAGLMLGRGAVADPALPRVLKGRKALEAQELKAFHDTLLDAYLAAGYDGRAAMSRLKELWFYMLYKFPDSRRESKQLLKSQTLAGLCISGLRPL